MKNMLVLSSIALLNACTISQKNCKKYLSTAYSKGGYDAIIVPGIPHGDSSKYNNFIMRSRFYWSYYLYQQQLARNIIYSGSAVYTPYTESIIMSMYATKLGIPAAQVFAETKAEHSTENLYYSYMMAKKMGFKSIAIASDPFQSRLLKKFAKQRGIDIDIVPIVYDTIRTLETKSLPIIDFNKAKSTNFIALPDREGFWKRFRGTLGKNIDYSAYQ